MSEQKTVPINTAVEDLRQLGEIINGLVADAERSEQAMKEVDPEDSFGMKKTKENIMKLGESLERQLTELYQQTEGQKFTFDREILREKRPWSSDPKCRTHCRYTEFSGNRNENGKMVVQCKTRVEKRDTFDWCLRDDYPSEKLCEVSITRKSERQLKKEAKKGLPSKELDIYVKVWGVSDGPIGEAYAGFGEELFNFPDKMPSSLLELNYIPEMIRSYLREQATKIGNLASGGGA